MVKKKTKRNKGFTLIELLIVIVIIGILVSIALPNFLAAQERARYASLKSNMRILQNSVETYGIDWGGRYPDNRKELFDLAVAGNYWESIVNPLSGEIDEILDISQFGALVDVDSFGVIYAGHASEPTAFTKAGAKPIYDKKPDASTYAIYGAGLYKEPFKVKSEYFYYSNY